MSELSDEKIAKLEKERRYAVNEILKTEKSFLHKLGVIQEVLVGPLVARNNVYKIVDDPRLSIFLSSASQIYKLNSEFYGDLTLQTNEGANPNGVGDIFLKYASLFRCYRQYSKFFDIAKHLIFSESSSSFKEFLEECKQDPRWENSPIESFLIKPIQRVPQYLLFLKQLMNAIPEKNEEYFKLESAEKELKGSMDVINEAIKNREDVEKLFELERLFRGEINLFSVGRKLIKDGRLSKVCRSREKEYHFHLFSDLLLYSSVIPGGFFNLHRRIDLRVCKIINMEDSKKHKNAFQIISNEKSFIALASSPEVKKDWLASIEKCLLDLMASTSRGGSLSRRGTTSNERKKRGTFSDEKLIPISDKPQDLAPIWTPNSEKKTCNLCNVQFNVFKRRHHCRSCGCLVCQDCSLQRRILVNISEDVPQRVCDECIQRLERDEVGSFRSSIDINETGILESIEENDPEKEFPSDFRWKILKSIVETERAYVADVEVLHEVFVRPLLEASLVSSPQNKSGCVKTQTSLGENLEVPTKLLSGKLATFLSEIETIYTLNLEFLEDLEGILDAWCGSDTMIGEVFQNYASLFKLYGEYAKGHGYASEKLTSDDFNEYVTACAKDPRCQEQLSIDMFLLKPLERVPSYIVLLNHLLDVTPLTHPDQRQLKLSLEKFYEVSNSIDETIRLDRNQSKIREIENRFASEMKLAHHKREFIREGYLNKVDRTGRAQRYIFHLFNDILIYSSITPRKMLKLHQTLQIRGMSVSGEIEHMFSHCIRIHSNPKSFIVFADSASEKEEWLRDLNNVIERSSQSIASEDNVQDSFIAPVWKSDNLVEYCQRCFVQFGLTTRRHHCRKCGDIICRKCSLHRVLISQVHVSQPQRVCDKCFDSLASDHSSADVDCSDMDGSISSTGSTTPISIQTRSAPGSRRGSFSNISKDVSPITTALPKNTTSKPVVWQQNSESDSCMVCFTKFSIFKHRHHCRNCGILVCNACAPANKIRKDSISGQMITTRVCKRCSVDRCD